MKKKKSQKKIRKNEILVRGKGKKTGKKKNIEEEKKIKIEGKREGERIREKMT